MRRYFKTHKRFCAKSQLNSGFKTATVLRPSSINPSEGKIKRDSLFGRIANAVNPAVPHLYARAGHSTSDFVAATIDQSTMWRGWGCPSSPASYIRISTSRTVTMATLLVLETIQEPDGTTIMVHASASSYPQYQQVGNAIISSRLYI